MLPDLGLFTLASSFCRTGCSSRRDTREHCSLAESSGKALYLLGESYRRLARKVALQVRMLTCCTQTIKRLALTCKHINAALAPILFKSLRIWAFDEQEALAFQQHLPTNTLSHVHHLDISFSVPRKLDGHKWTMISQTIALVQDRISRFNNIKRLTVTLDLTFLDEPDLLHAGLTCHRWLPLAHLLQSAVDDVNGDLGTDITLQAVQAGIVIPYDTLNLFARHFADRNTPGLFIAGVDIGPQDAELMPVNTVTEALSDLHNFRSLHFSHCSSSDLALRKPILRLEMLLLTEQYHGVDHLIQEGQRLEWPDLLYLHVRVDEERDFHICRFFDSIRAPKLERLELQNLKASSVLYRHQIFQNLIKRSTELNTVRLELYGPCQDYEKSRVDLGNLKAYLGERDIQLELELRFVLLHSLDFLSERHFSILEQVPQLKIMKIEVDLRCCADPSQRPRTLILPDAAHLRFMVDEEDFKTAPLQWFMEAFKCPNLKCIEFCVSGPALEFMGQISAFVPLLPAKCRWRIDRAGHGEPRLDVRFKGFAADCKRFGIAYEIVDSVPAFI